MRRAATWLTAGAMLVAAWLVSGATPDGEQRITDPFVVPARLDEPVVADNLGLTIRDVRLADRVTTGGWFAEGRWLVVTLDAGLRHREPATLGLGYLVVGDRTFQVSERVKNYDADASLSGRGLHVGIPQSGTLVFELPEDIAADDAAARAVLQLAVGAPFANLSPTQNQRGTAVVEMPVDLTALAHDAEVALPDTTWTTP